MAEERGAKVPKDCDWESLKVRSGTDLTDHYADILRKLREAGGLLADIFAIGGAGRESAKGLRLGIAESQVWNRLDRSLRRHPAQTPRSRRSPRRHFRDRRSGARKCQRIAIGNR